jgi:hypothetical protein
VNKYGKRGEGRKEKEKEGRCKGRNERKGQVRICYLRLLRLVPSSDQPGKKEKKEKKKKEVRRQE